MASRGFFSAASERADCAPYVGSEPHYVNVPIEVPLGRYEMCIGAPAQPAGCATVTVQAPGPNLCWSEPKAPPFLVDRTAAGESVDEPIAGDPDRWVARWGAPGATNAVRQILGVAPGYEAWGAGEIRLEGIRLSTNEVVWTASMPDASLTAYSATVGLDATVDPDGQTWVLLSGIDSIEHPTRGFLVFGDGWTEVTRPRASGWAFEAAVLAY